jgi:hypothetical protein
MNIIKTLGEAALRIIFAVMILGLLTRLFLYTAGVDVG